MLKISECRELDVFDHMDLLEIMQNKAVKLFCEKNNLNEESTCKFELDKKHFAILHKSSKKNNTFQLRIKGSREGSGTVTISLLDTSSGKSKVIKKIDIPVTVKSR